MAVALVLTAPQLLAEESEAAFGCVKELVRNGLGFGFVLEFDDDAVAVAVEEEEEVVNKDFMPALVELLGTLLLRPSVREVGFNRLLLTLSVSSSARSSG